MKFVIDERDGTKGTKGAEFLCVFDDKRTDARTGKHGCPLRLQEVKAENPEKSGPDIIQNLSEWVKSDFVDAE